MAEEQFTSRRARREAERVAAEQAFEAREAPEQPSEPEPNSGADPSKPASALDTSAPAPGEEPDSGPTVPEAEPVDTTSQVEPEPAPPIDLERAALAADDPMDPQHTPLPHFGTRSARKRYLREHGLSLEGDVSTGAIPVIAEPEAPVNDAEAEEGTSSETESVGPESFDTAGFGGSADEVAARDFESPVTPNSAPRSATFDEETVDALSRPIENLDSEIEPVPEAQQPEESATLDRSHSTDSSGSDENTPEATATGEDISEEAASAVEVPDDELAHRSRSRRMPIVQPPTTSGVRVVTAASAQIPEVDSPESSPQAEGSETEKTESVSALEQTTDSESGSNEGGTASSSDDAARALAANPETRPMDTVPEAWALPNPDYEDEETENPPGTRIRASDVTGHDGRILVGEEPSKVPFVVLGVAAIFAVALIVIALIMLL